MVLTKKEESSVVNAIEKIEVSITNNQTENREKTLSPLEIVEVKKYLKDTYDISESNIDIGG